MSVQDPPEPAASAFRAWRLGFWRHMLAPSGPRRERRYMALAVGLVGVIGFADFLTGFELSFLVFYLVPVCIAVAAVGWRLGTLTAVLSVVTWLASDYAAGASFENSFVPVWNALIALGTYLIVVWLLASVIGLQREMEERVRQRTASLTEEIAERVRLEKAVLEITERERRAIGHDLHDGLSQHLTGTSLVAQAFGTRIAAHAPQDAAEMRKIVGLIEQGIEQTRSLAKGLLLAEIERDGLVNALHDLAATLRVQSRIDCEFSCETEGSLEESGTATHLYRIAAEAARNALRHGRAKRIDLRLSAAGGFLVLAVRDDGSGLPPPASRGQGLGLRIMAHRAAIIGAALSFEAAPPSGTLVTCRLPYSTGAR